MRTQQKLFGTFARSHILTLAVAAVGVHSASGTASAKLSVTLTPDVGSMLLDDSFSKAMFARDFGFASARNLRTESPSLRGGATADATARTYTGSAGTGLFSSASNWTPSGAPVAGDSITFGTSPAGNYTVTNDLASGTALGDVIVARGNATPAITTTLNGGVTGNRIEVTNGGLVLNGGNSVVTSVTNSADTTSTTFSMRIGALAGNTGALTMTNGATLTYNDFLHGSKTGSGKVTLTGAGTKLLPVVGIDHFSNYQGGGAGVSTTLVDAGASLTTNVLITNRTDTITVSNNSTLTCANYQMNGVNADTGEPEIQNFGGELLVGYFTYDPAAAAPLATLNVTSGSTVNSRFTYLSAVGIGQTSVVNVNAGTANFGSLDMSDPIQGDPNADTTVPGSFNRSTLDISNGGVANAFIVLAATADTSTATVKVRGIGSQLNVDGGPIIMGGLSDNGDVGTGSSELQVSAGGAASCVQLNLGDFSAETAASTYSGNNVSVDGAGSKITITGVPAVPESAPGAGDGADAFGANIYMSDGSKRHSTISVTNGGHIDMKNDAVDPGENGSLYVGNGSNSVSLINVDGAGSVFNAGTYVDVIEGSGRNGWTNAQATINVKNGGTFFVADEDSDFGGQLVLGPTVSNGAVITVNVGGGATAADADSTFGTDGILFVGGNGPTSAPVKGVATTINVDNGEVFGGVVAVYQGSTIKLNKGVVDGSLLTVVGGNIKLSSTAPAGTGVLFANDFEATNNGTFDIGNSGGVSILLDSADTDLADIKTLINAGLTGGANSIRSDLVTAAGSNLSVGYFLRAADSTRASFLGVDLDSTHAYVLFRTTLKGDANLSGNVNFDDLILLAQNYNKTGKEWYEGDFTHDGTVNFDDLIPLAQNYNTARPGGIDFATVFGSDFAADWALAQSLVPEPMTLGALAAVGTLVARRRRR